MRTPLTEAGGRLHRRKLTKTPTGKRWVQLPGFLHTLHTELIAPCEGEYLCTGPQGRALRRGNFRARFWRPAWDGASTHEVAWMRRPLLPGMARVYEYVALQMEERVLSVLETLWEQSVHALTPVERERLFSMAPSLEEHYHGDTKNGLPEEPASKSPADVSHCWVIIRDLHTRGIL